MRNEEARGVAESGKREGDRRARPLSRLPVANARRFTFLRVDPLPLFFFHEDQTLVFTALATAAVLRPLPALLQRKKSLRMCLDAPITRRRLLRGASLAEFLRESFFLLLFLLPKTCQGFVFWSFPSPGSLEDSAHVPRRKRATCLIFTAKP